MGSLPVLGNLRRFAAASRMKKHIYSVDKILYYGSHNMEDPEHANPYDGIASRYDAAFNEDNLYYRHIESREREVFERWIPEGGGKKEALDIGCGTGLHSRWLVERGYSVCGIDNSPKMLSVAVANSRDLGRRVRFAQHDACQLDVAFPRQTFDVVVCLGSTINHVSDWRKVFQGVAACLRPGGRFVFNFDNSQGVDTLFWLLKRGRSIYPQDARRLILLRKLWAAATGRYFHNHWSMDIDHTRIEVPLTYDSVAGAQAAASESGLRFVEASGVHLITVMSRSVMEASAFVTTAHASRGGAWARWLCVADSMLSKKCPILSSNVVVVATIGG